MELAKIKQRLELLYQEVEKLEREGGGSGGTSDYTELTNKPSINGVELNGNKTLTQLGIASASNLSSLISQFDDLFAVDNVSVVSDGEYPSTLDSRLALHQPINLNNVNYYFFEESGVDYSYFSIDTSGAYPKISLAQLLKDSHRVVFYEFAVDTVPTDNSDNFITSGGVYTALAGKQDTLTTAQQAAVDSGITAAKVTQYDKDNAALIQQVDNGAKNFISANNVTLSRDGYIFNNIDCNIAPGQYVISLNSTQEVQAEIILKDSNNTILIDNSFGAVNPGFYSFTLTSTATKASLYIGGASTISDIMICTKAAWDVSQKYVPYVPSMAEMYQTNLSVKCTDISDAMTDNLETRTITNGYATAGVAGLAAGWCSITTMPLNNSTGTSERKYQKLFMVNGTDGGKTKIRLYSGSWGNWAEVP